MDALQKLSDPSGACVRFNGRGVGYEEFSCLYPLIGATYMDWEMKYDIKYVHDLMESSPWFPPVAIGLYFAMMHFGQTYFANRKPWDCRKYLALWNLSLSIFSLWGFVRLLPHLLHLSLNYTLIETACFDPETTYGSGTSGMWIQFWVVSKPIEFLDTFFLIVHKKPVIFLHWFHHAMTMAASWYLYLNSINGGMYIAMNYGVHAIMYFYYCLMSIKMKPKWFNPKWITVMQIWQMMIGLYIIFNGLYIVCVLKPPNCGMMNAWNLGVPAVFYLILLILFTQFYLRRYLAGKMAK